MADRASVSKSVAYAVTGNADSAIATKVVAYIVLEPGESADTSNRQGHVHTQILRRS